MSLRWNTIENSSWLIFPFYHNLYARSKYNFTLCWSWQNCNFKFNLKRWIKWCGWIFFVCQSNGNELLVVEDWNTEDPRAQIQRYFWLDFGWNSCTDFTHAHIFKACMLQIQMKINFQHCCHQKFYVVFAFI